MQLGVFIPIGNNGWLISTTSRQYKPSFDLNRAIVEMAERFGFDFALSMIKLHGFDGASQFWDYNLESFTLMAGRTRRDADVRRFRLRNGSGRHADPATYALARGAEPCRLRQLLRPRPACVEWDAAVRDAASGPGADGLYSAQNLTS